MIRYCVPLVALLAVGCGSSGPTTTDLIAELGDPSDEVRFAARFELAAQGKEAEPYLLQALNDPNSRIRFGSSTILRARASELSVEALPYLERAAGDGNCCVRDNAVQTIGSLGPRARTVVPTLYQALQDPDSHVKRSAILALGKVVGARAVPQLVQLLQDTSLKYTAALALERLGPSAAAAIPALEALGREDDDSSRKAAADALLRIRAVSAPSRTTALPPATLKQI